MLSYGAMSSDSTFGSYEGHLSSNLDPDRNILTEIFRRIPQTLQANA
jgi:hypothetical protein